MWTVTRRRPFPTRPAVHMGRLACYRLSSANWSDTLTVPAAVILAT